jgi:hypothetical protein
MSSLISVQTLIEYIEALPAQEQTLLFDELFRRNIIKQRQENIDYSTVKVTPAWAMSASNRKVRPGKHLFYSQGNSCLGDRASNKKVRPGKHQGESKHGQIS